MHAFVPLSTEKWECPVSLLKSADTAEKIEALEKQFDDLHERLMSELTRGRCCSGEELLRALTMLPISVRKSMKVQYSRCFQPWKEGVRSLRSFFV